MVLQTSSTESPTRSKTPRDTSQAFLRLSSSGSFSLARPELPEVIPISRNSFSLQAPHAHTTPPLHPSPRSRLHVHQFSCPFKSYASSFSHRRTLDGHRPVLPPFLTRFLLLPLSVHLLHVFSFLGHSCNPPILRSLSSNAGFLLHFTLLRQTRWRGNEVEREEKKDGGGGGTVPAVSSRLRSAHKPHPPSLFPQSP